MPAWHVASTVASVDRTASRGGLDKRRRRAERGGGLDALAVVAERLEVSADVMMTGAPRRITDDKRQQ